MTHGRPPAPSGRARGPSCELPTAGSCGSGNGRERGRPSDRAALFSWLALALLRTAAASYSIFIPAIGSSGGTGLSELPVSELGRSSITIPVAGLSPLFRGV